MRSRSPGGPAFFIPIPNGAGSGAGVGQPRVASVPNQPALMAGPVNANGAVDAPQGRGQPPSLEDIYTTTWHEPNLLAVGQGQPQAQPLFPGKPTGYGKGQGPAARAIAAHPANELQPTGPDGSVLPAVLDDGPAPATPMTLPYAMEGEDSDDEMSSDGEVPLADCTMGTDGLVHIDLTMEDNRAVITNQNLFQQVTVGIPAEQVQNLCETAAREGQNSVMNEAQRAVS